jgi:probable HAF family extracellular repeat protein
MTIANFSRKLFLHSSAILPALFFLNNSAVAQDAFADLGNLGGSYSYTYGVSADGTTFVGYSYPVDSHNQHAFRWNNGEVEDLGTLGGSYSIARAVSADGAVVAGNSNTTANTQHAFRWVDGTMTDLGTLGGTSSYTYDISADGAVVVGDSNTEANYNIHAFRWVDGTMTDLGTLGGTYSTAIKVSDDGAVVAGNSYTTANTQHAFRWVDGTMTDLGTLGGTYSYARDISANGAVVVGESYISDSDTNHAFRWVDGTMTDLGTLGGFYSDARAVSADGAVVAGVSETAENNGTRVFRWVDDTITSIGTVSDTLTSQNISAMSADGNVIVGTEYDYSGIGLSISGPGSESTVYYWSEAVGIQSITDWIEGNGGTVPLSYTINEARGLSADGSVVVGSGYNDGVNSAWLAHGNGFLSDTAAFDQSLIQTGRASVSSALAATNLALDGAHHRSLLDMGLQVGPTGWFAWSTADAAKNDYTDTSIILAETGIGRDFGDYRLGFAIGSSETKQDWDLGGNATFTGTYALAEIARAFPLAGGGSIHASLLGYYATHDTQLNRAYASGSGTDISSGSPELESSALKAKIDWTDATQFGQVAMSPYAALTLSNAKVDGYTETGGAFPATYGTSSSDSGNVRIGAAFTFNASESVPMRLGIEGVHQFDKNANAVIGSVDDLYAFDLVGADRKSNWARLTLDTDYAISSTAILTAGLNMSTQGNQPTIGITIGLKAAF